MNPFIVTGLIIVFLCVDAIIVYAIFSMVAEELRSLARQFPPVSPQPDARRREFQSFRVNLINLGWSLHASLDRTHLHLEPTWLLRLLGAGPCSIPRAQITNATRTLTGAKASIGGSTVYGPRWCLLPDA